MTNILEIRNLKKTFPDFTAVHKVDFNVEEGGFFSILGPSGCGKTTLLRMIAGFEEQTDGDIIIQGKSMNGIPPEKRPVNIVFQSLALFPMMNVQKNVAFGLQRLKLSKDEINSKVHDMLERVGLLGYEKKQISELSGGQKQRVALARSLVLKPSILLLDEPLSALDRKLREYMKIELKTLQRELGTTFIYITHDQSEALVMSDKIAVMNNGRFEQIDTPKNLYRNPKTSFVAGFVGENNQFEVQSYENNILKMKNGWTLIKKDLKIIPKKVFIRPEALIISPNKNISNTNTIEVTIKTILFDGANTKLSVIINNTIDEMKVSLPQNALFEDLSEGDNLNLAVAYDDVKCYES